LIGLANEIAHQYHDTIAELPRSLDPAGNCASTLKISGRSTDGGNDPRFGKA